ncbi:hypothetical protein DSJ_04730 [Pantoea stewartii subsp. stewartii DC283]|uniref:Uncharacterized protein n=1 Tax=Pantoea stewartii subsp. stewartii DC283 TaxID=660596 RepID=A0ABN4YV91_PANSE|nr:hypothetical protein DSJ_04730 [Pantoea stewartii subsp. stewartii DC283]
MRFAPLMRCLPIAQQPDGLSQSACSFAGGAFPPHSCGGNPWLIPAFQRPVSPAEITPLMAMEPCCF